MKTVTTRDVHRLIEHRDPPCVSVYMTADPVRPGGRADRTRLRNLLREAADMLCQRHHRRDVDRLLRPLAELATQEWPSRARGIGLLASPGMRLGLQLPIAVPEVAVVASTFHTKPLISFLDRNRHFFVLTLSEKSARLLEGTAEGLTDVAARSLPEHLRTPGPDRGHDEPEHARKHRLRRWLRLLDGAVTTHAREAPLVLAGVRALRALYHSMSGHPWIVEDGVDGNVERLPIGELHARAWPILLAEEADREAAAVALFHSSRARGRATDVLADVILAAGAGRVRLLLHREGAHLWGRMDPATGGFITRAGAAAPLPGDSDLIDDLCELTLLRGGHVVEVAPERMPTDVPLAAVLRC